MQIWIFPHEVALFLFEIWIMMFLFPLTWNSFLPRIETRISGQMESTVHDICMSRCIPYVQEYVIVIIICWICKFFEMCWHVGMLAQNSTLLCAIFYFVTGIWLPFKIEKSVAILFLVKKKIISVSSDAKNNFLWALCHHVGNFGH